MKGSPSSPYLFYVPRFAVGCDEGIERGRVWAQPAVHHLRVAEKIGFLVCPAVSRTTWCLTATPTQASQRPVDGCTQAYAHTQEGPDAQSSATGKYRRTDRTLGDTQQGFKSCNFTSVPA